MGFTTFNLAGDRVLIEGTDVRNHHNQTVVDGTQWAGIKRAKEAQARGEAFDAKIREFFAPLVEALEGLEPEQPKDDLYEVVLEEAVEAVEGKVEQRIRLTHDSVILRLIEEGQESRLIWVGDKLEVLAEAPGVPADFGGGVIPEVTAA